MIHSRNILDLLPVVALKASAFVAACRAIGIDVLITSTLRDAEAQTALYAQGRTRPGRVVTNARAGQSWHNHGCAFDFVPIMHGKAMWEDTRTFERCGLVAEALGLEWAGRWTGRLREMSHCQYTAGLTLADLRAGRRVA